MGLELEERGLSRNCVYEPWEIVAIYADEEQKMLVTEHIEKELSHFKTTHSVIED